MEGQLLGPGLGTAGYTCDDKENDNLFTPCTADLFGVMVLGISVAKPQHGGVS